MSLSKQEIGAVLRKLREDKGYTQKQVAEHFGRTQQVIGHWETGYSQPDAATLFDLCDFYGSDISSDFGYKPKSPSIKDGDEKILELYHRLDPDDRRLIQGEIRGLLLQEKYRKDSASAAG